VSREACQKAHGVQPWPRKGKMFCLYLYGERRERSEDAACGAVINQTLFWSSLAPNVDASGLYLAASALILPSKAAKISMGSCDIW